MSNATQFAGKIALVSGASGPVGAATVLELLARGASVTAVDAPQASFDALVQQAGEGASLHLCHADPTDAGQVAHAADEARRAFGQLDLYSHNLDLEALDAALAVYPADAFRRTLDSAVVGVFLGLKTVMPLLTAGGGGSIVVTACEWGPPGARGRGADLASRKALIGLARAAALEGAGLGVRVNAIFVAGGAGPADTTAPSDAARLTAFLSCDEAQHITGGVNALDGGSAA